MADYIEGEEWRPVVGYEEHYAVSNTGRVKRTSYGKRTNPGRLRKITTARSGYQWLRLNVDGQESKALFVHRLVLEAFIGPRPDLDVNHKNGNKSDNRLENLEYCTRAENIRHAIREIRTMKYDHVSGQNGVVSKLTDIQARMIRDLHATGKYSQVTLAAAFGVSQPAIHHVLYKRQEATGWTADHLA